jgi:hypothetical protein
LTVPDAPSIRPPLAAGAIPPPLFFEQRRCGSTLASSHGIFKNGLRQNTLENTTSVDHAI